MRAIGRIATHGCAAPNLLKHLLALRATGNDMRMLRAVLEHFWPSRRMNAFDQFCS
jgi:hypothetical protein